MIVELPGGEEVGELQRAKVPELVAETHGVLLDHNAPEDVGYVVIVVLFLVSRPRAARQGSASAPTPAPAMLGRVRRRARSNSQYVTQSAWTSSPSSTSSSGVNGWSLPILPASATKRSSRSASREASDATAPPKIRRMTNGFHWPI